MKRTDDRKKVKRKMNAEVTGRRYGWNDGGKKALADRDNVVWEGREHAWVRPEWRMIENR